MNSPTHAVTLRTSIEPGNCDAILALHSAVYCHEYGFDRTFESHVSGPLRSFFERTPSARERIWLAERDGDLVGCIAIVETSRIQAQLRWFVVDPTARGTGLGSRLLDEAVAFCVEIGYESVFLWTVNILSAAARRYRTAGFTIVEERQTNLWGVELVEQRYELTLPR